MDELESLTRHWWRVCRVLSAARNGMPIEDEPMPASEAVDELEFIERWAPTSRLRARAATEAAQWREPAVVASLMTDAL